MTDEIYDLTIIGGGPTALSTGTHTGRAMMDTLIIEKDKIGGQVTATSGIVNCPAIRHTTSPELTEEMRIRTQDFGVVPANDEIIDADSSQTAGAVQPASRTYQTYTVLVATGVSACKIGFPGKSEFTGRGMVYCSTRDGEFFQGLDTLVVGGGYIAAEEAVCLIRYGKSITATIREPDFTCARLTVEAAEDHPRIKIVYNIEVKKITGDDFVRKAVFVSNQMGEETVYEAPKDSILGLSTFAGGKPSTEIFEGRIPLDRRRVPITENMGTSVPGVYTTGDLRIKELCQIVTAVADGTIAATHAQCHVIEQKTQAGQLIVIKQTTERLTNQSASGASSQQSKEKQPTKVTGKHRWFPESMRQQLGGIFIRLTKKVTLSQFLNTSSEKSLELQSFLTEFASLDQRIILETILKDTESAKELLYGTGEMPSAMLLDVTGNYAGIKSSGILNGHEVNSLVLVVYNVGSERQPLETGLQKDVLALSKGEIEISVSLTCHFCLGVTAACQRITSINSRVGAEMVGIGLFPELKKEKKIMSVPAMLIDGGQAVFGSKIMTETIEALT